ncbi:mitochondrial carrier domain-containing protein [Leucosporidium creatinivorum]|uniref:Mitochondrial carrier domain-containing protein n=1 Tax=Leucosporidium creatinivorum TaxID=106004 RepID=A0A1Y2EEN7_9BASI|nr:mitochondrial carrier domain-containing protein [Leucosporidium creatinivorum]
MAPLPTPPPAPLASQSAADSPAPSPPPSPPKDKRRPPAAVHLIAGGLGGMCGSVVTAPFDLVKTRLQSDMFQHRSTTTKQGVKVAQHGIKQLLGNFVDTGLILRDVYKYEGPSALFKGLGPTLVGVVPGRSINFFVYGNGKQLYADYFNHGQENSAVHLSAAATAGVITAAATNPIWVVKTVMQLQQQQRAPTPGISPSIPHPSSTATASSSRPLPPLPTPPKPPASTFSHSFRSITSPPLPLTNRPTSYSTTIAIFRAEGIRGFYKGLSASLLGVTEGTIQWTLYEKFKSVANHGKRAEEQGGWRVSAAAGGAKLVATMITYPHEVIRTRLRQPAPPGQSPRYTSLLQSFRLVLLEEGWRALYGGLSPHLLRVVPNAVTMYWVYERVIATFVPVNVQESLRVD